MFLHPCDRAGCHTSAVTQYSTLGAVDLGSNSFHLAIGRVVDDQIYPLDSLKETVRLGTGLTAEKHLDAQAQERAIAALKRFSERLSGMPRAAVRVVGTNALRVAKNAGPFLRRAETTLGFPIEVIPGREEARLIYLGVVHSLPMANHNRLVVDIGGGSTEFIIGNKLRPKAMESLYMGYSGPGSGSARLPRVVSAIPARMSAMPAMWKRRMRSPRKSQARKLPKTGIRCMRATTRIIA